jgi:hypothetical protein
MEFIRQNKLFTAIMVGLFIPSGLVSWVGGFVNWGFASLLVMVLAVRWAYPRVRDFASDALADDDEW